MLVPIEWVFFTPRIFFLNATYVVWLSIQSIIGFFSGEIKKKRYIYIHIENAKNYIHFHRFIPDVSYNFGWVQNK